MTMSTILSSRFVAGIRTEVERVERQLNLFADTLDQWIQASKGCAGSTPAGCEYVAANQPLNPGRVLTRLVRQWLLLHGRNECGPSAQQQGAQPLVVLCSQA